MADQIEPMERLRNIVEDILYINKSKKLDPNKLQSFYTDFIRPCISEVISDLCSSIRKSHKITPETLNSQFGKKLVHYTSLNTIVTMLKKIKENQNDYLRMYDSSHFNDPDEGNYLLRISELPELNKLVDDIEKQARPSYVASFVQSIENKDISDDLVFWRTYGDEGEGCSLTLMNRPVDQLKSIFYGKEKAKQTIERIEKVWKDIYNIIRPIFHILEESIVQTDLAAIIEEEIEDIRYLYKSKAYEHENEVRFIETESSIKDHNGELKFDFSRADKPLKCLRLYYENQDLSTKKIFVSGTTITLGPCVKDAYNMRYYLENLKRKANLCRVDIKISKIRYRKT